MKPLRTLTFLVLSVAAVLWSSSALAQDVMVPEGSGDDVNAHGTIEVTTPENAGEKAYVYFQPNEGYELFSYIIARSDREVPYVHFFPQYGGRGFLDESNAFEMKRFPYSVTALFMPSNIEFGENLVTNPGNDDKKWTSWDGTSTELNIESDSCFKFTYKETYFEQTVALPQDVEYKGFFFSCEISRAWYKGYSQGFVKAKLTFKNDEGETVGSEIEAINLDYKNGAQPWDIFSYAGEIPSGATSVTIKFSGKDNCGWAGGFGPWVDEIKFHALTEVIEQSSFETVSVPCALRPLLKIETDEETGKQTVSVSSQKGFFELFNSLASGDDDISDDADVNFTADIVSVDTIAISLDTIPIETAQLLYPTIESVGTLSNNINASQSSMTGLVFNTSGGLATEISENAGIYDMVFDSAKAIVDIKDESKYLVRGDTVFIPLVAQKNNGKIENFGFSGDVYVDEDAIPEGKVVAICLTIEMSDSAALTGFLYLNDIFAMGSGDNKRCITLKQNLGCAIPPPGKSTTKVATSKAGNNKSVDMDEFNYSDAELNQNTRAFTKREFASGVVAYWLNYSGPGYTGTYQDKWSQGIAYPVAATKNADGEYNTVQKVIYEFKGDNSALTAAPLFVNNGESMTIKYDSKPKSITCGDNEVVLGETSATFTYRKGEKVLVDYSEPEPEHSINTSLADVNSSRMTVKVVGSKVTVSGAEGKQLQLHDILGQTIAQSSTGSLVAPTSGIFILTVDGNAWKIVIK